MTSSIPWVTPFFHTTAPNNPSIGEIWYDVANQQCNMFDGKNWNILLPAESNQIYVKRIRVNKYYDVIIREKNKEFVYDLEKLPEYSTFSANLDSILYETSFEEIIITLTEFGISKEEIDVLKIEVEREVINVL